MPDVQYSTEQRLPRILLVDDDVLMLSVQSRMLHAMGYSQVKTAESSEGALHLLNSEQADIDLIICDLNMPGLDGIEFLQTLNAGSFRGHVILLSGEGRRIMHTVQRLLGGGRLEILGAIQKPAGRDALRSLLERWKPLAAKAAPRPAPLVTIADLQDAVHDEQWVLHHQPKVDLRTGEFVGVESLIRWNHPTHGLIYPDHFIGMAEDCGAINALTSWVLAEGMRQLTAWQVQGIRTKVAINISMEDLRDPQFSRRLAAIAHAAGVSPSDITLEVTESRLMSPSPAPLENLVRMRMQRFGLSIDDFGTGHSSLVQLRDVPFTELKVDRSFVQNSRHNQIIRPMLEGSIGIAKRLQMQSVAEGVETEDDWHLLREIGCDIAQGWFIARPMPADELAGWLTTWRMRQPGLVES